MGADGGICLRQGDLTSTPKPPHGGDRKGENRSTTQALGGKVAGERQTRGPTESSGPGLPGY